MPLSRELSSRITRVFDLDARGSSVATEARGAVATFLTMAYILFANPSILAAAGVPFESAVAATAASAAVCSILMGVVANAMGGPGGHAVTALDERVDRLLMVIEAMWSLLKENGYTDEQLAARIKDLDESDGSADGRRQARSGDPGSRAWHEPDGWVRRRWRACSWRCRAR